MDAHRLSGSSAGRLGIQIFTSLIAKGTVTHCAVMGGQKLTHLFVQLLLIGARIQWFKRHVLAHFVSAPVDPALTYTGKIGM